MGMTVTLSFGIVTQPHMMIRYYTAVDARTIKLLGSTTPIYLMTLYIPGWGAPSSWASCSSGTCCP